MTSEDRSADPHDAGGVTGGEQELGALVEACVAGDRDAMRQIYEACSDRVFALMVRMVGRQEADDLTQQIFLKMFAKLDQFSGQSKLETWLFRLATNEALQFLRRKKRQTTGPLALEPAAESDDPVMAAEQHQQLENALQQLSPELRTILTLKEEQGLSYREIAEIVEIPEGTVGSRLNRARRLVRDTLVRAGW